MDVLIMYQILPAILATFFGALFFAIFVIPVLMGVILGGKSPKDW